MLIEASRNEHRTTALKGLFESIGFFAYKGQHPPPLRGPPPSREDLRSRSLGAKYKFAEETAN